MPELRDKILMCPPTHFSVDYVINPWMAGQKGSRIALPNSRIMVHQPSGGYSGKAQDIRRHGRHSTALG